MNKNEFFILVKKKFCYSNDTIKYIAQNSSQSMLLSTCTLQLNLYNPALSLPQLLPLLNWQY